MHIRIAPVSKMYHALESVHDWVVDRRTAFMCSLIFGLITSLLLRHHRPLDFGRWRQFGLAAGFGLLAFGLALRSWAAALLRKSEALATQGPYELCRNPLYLGSLLMTGGFCVLIADVATTVILAIGFSVTIGPTIRLEEQKLSERFGKAWTDYVDRIPTIVPRSCPQSVGPVSLSTWLRNREYNAVIASIVGLVAWAVWLNCS